MTNLILMTLAVATMAVAAYQAGVSGNWTISCNRADFSVEGPTQTLQAGGIQIRTSAMDGKTVMRGVRVASPIGPIELLYVVDRP